MTTPAAAAAAAAVAAAAPTFITNPLRKDANGTDISDKNKLAGMWVQCNNNNLLSSTTIEEIFVDGVFVDIHPDLLREYWDSESEKELLEKHLPNILPAEELTDDAKRAYAYLLYWVGNELYPEGPVTFYKEDKNVQYSRFAQLLEEAWPWVSVKLTGVAFTKDDVAKTFKPKFDFTNFHPISSPEIEFPKNQCGEISKEELKDMPEGSAEHEYWRNIAFFRAVKNRVLPDLVTNLKDPALQTFDDEWHKRLMASNADAKTTLDFLKLTGGIADFDQQLQKFIKGDAHPVPTLFNNCEKQQNTQAGGLDRLLGRIRETPKERTFVFDTFTFGKNTMSPPAKKLSFAMMGEDTVFTFVNEKERGKEMPDPASTNSTEYFPIDYLSIIEKLRDFSKKPTVREYIKIKDIAYLNTPGHLLYEIRNGDAVLDINPYFMVYLHTRKNLMKDFFKGKLVPVPPTSLTADKELLHYAAAYYAAMHFVANDNKYAKDPSEFYKMDVAAKEKVLGGYRPGVVSKVKAVFSKAVNKADQLQEAIRDAIDWVTPGAGAAAAPTIGGMLFGSARRYTRKARRVTRV